MRVGMRGHEYWDNPAGTQKVLTVSRGGHTYRMYDPGGHGRIAKTLRKGAPVEPSVLDDMATLDVSGRAVDAGGGVGNHALWLALVCGLEVEVFEPRLFGIIAANVRLNDLEGRVRVHEVGLSDKPGTARWSDKLRGHLELGGKDVVLRTLDEFGFDDVSVLKIDVEGMEERVIEGGLETIERCRPYIYAEAWDDTYRKRISNLLQPLGYTYGRKFNWHQNRWNP